MLGPACEMPPLSLGEAPGSGPSGELDGTGDDAWPEFSSASSNGADTMLETAANTAATTASTTSGTTGADTEGSTTGSSSTGTTSTAGDTESSADEDGSDSTDSTGEIALPQISAGFDHHCWIDKQGARLACRGAPPGTDVPQDDSIWPPSAVLAGFGWSCVLVSDVPMRLRCWGIERDEDIELSKTLDLDLVGISGADRHVCVVYANGDVDCHEITGDTGWASLDPPNDGQYVRVCSGEGHACALTGKGDIDCWGSAVWAGSAVQPLAGPFVALGCGDDYDCGLRSDGRLECWAEQGDRHPILQQLPEPGPVLHQVHGERQLLCGLDAQREITCWSTFDDGGETPPAGPVGELAVGGGFACAMPLELPAREAPECWGFAVDESRFSDQ